MLRVKAVVLSAIVMVIALVFFPLWLGAAVAVLGGVFGLSVALLGAAVVLDPAAGVVGLRLGLLFQRIRLTDITAVIVDKAKVSIGRANGGEVSLYAWRQGRLDTLLGLPVVASDIGHAISQAATTAQTSGTADIPRRPDAGQTSQRTRSRLATALLGGAGVLAIVFSLLVRVHWDNTALTVIGVIIALALGISGLLYLLVALWILLTGRSPRFTESA